MPRRTPRGVGTLLGQQGRATEASLVDAARVLADVRLAIATFGPDAVAMVRASPSTRTMSDADAVAFLSGDTNFMVRAGAANKDMYEKESRGRHPVVVQRTVGHRGADAEAAGPPPR